MIAPPTLAAPGRFGEFEGRLLAPADVPALQALRDEVLGALADADLYVREDDEAAFLGALCGERGETFGVFDEGRLVAYGAVGFPAACDEDNLGRVLGLPSADWDKVAHVASCMVLPSHRHHGLQRALLRARFALALAAGRRIAVAMVSLRNHESRHNMLRQGMRIRWVGELDHGLKRQLLVKDLLDLRPAEPVRECRLLTADDYAGQRAAVAEGFQGVGEVRDNGSIRLEFVR